MKTSQTEGLVGVAMHGLFGLLDLSSVTLRRVAAVAQRLDVAYIVPASTGQRNDVILGPNETIPAVWPLGDVAPSMPASRALIESF